MAIAFFLAGKPGFAQPNYEGLVEIDAEIVELAKPVVVNGIPDLSKSSIEARRKKADEFRRRLRAFDVRSWATPEKVDYLVVWSKVNELVFTHDVMRPWARDPLMYLYQVSRVPYAEITESDEDLTSLSEQLRAVPSVIEQAKENLKEPVGELAKLTIFHLENFDGVGQGEPYRPEPPGGTIGWFKDLCGRIAAQGNDLLRDCREATSAVQGFRDWLVENLHQMDSSAAIGVENFNWYLKHVRLLPYTVKELEQIGEREFHRFRFKYIVDKNRNKGLPELAITGSAEQHRQRTKAAEEKIRATVEEQDLLTIPDYMPDEFETDTYWSPRAESNRHFWEEIQFRNALNNHIHASIPGHRFDGLMREHLENPIRRSHGESARAEGWGVYLEELFLQAGITDDNPRARELFYTALIKRGSRIYAEIGMHTGAMSLEEANTYMIDWVPFMEENLGRYDLAGYLRRPGLGSMYVLGKTEIEQLVSERAFQLGEEFDLGDFHDDFLSRGIIPVTLIRWEMTGFDDQVRAVWPEVVGQPFPESE